MLAHLNRLYAKAARGHQLSRQPDVDLWLWFEEMESKQPSQAKAIDADRKKLWTDTEKTSLDPASLQRHRDQLMREEGGGEAQKKLLVTDHLLQLLDQQQELLSLAERSAKDQRKLEQIASGIWLTQAIESGFEVPEAFATRPQYPSSIVTREVRDEVNDLIDRDLVDSYTPAGGGTACLYLSKRGRRAVAKELGYGNQVSKVRWTPVRTFVADQLTHRTAQMDFRIALLLAAKKAGFEVKKGAWLDTPDLEERIGGQTVELQVARKRKDNTAGKGRKRVTLKIMDDFVSVDTGLNWVQHMGIEVDCGSRTIYSESLDAHDIAMKYRTWSAFVKSNQHQKTLGIEDPGWFLTITTQGGNRLMALQEAMVKVLRKDAALDRYWFTCLDWVSPSHKAPYDYSIFSQPIWLRGDSTELVVMDLEGHARRQQGGKED